MKITHPGLFEVSGGYYTRSSSGPAAVVLSDAYARFNGQNVTTVHWTQIEGVKASIQGASTINPTVTLPSPGSYRFRCTATTNHTPPFVKTFEAGIVYGD